MGSEIYGEGKGGDIYVVMERHDYECTAELISGRNKPEDEKGACYADLFRYSCVKEIGTGSNHEGYRHQVFISPHCLIWYKPQVN